MFVHSRRICWKMRGGMILFSRTLRFGWIDFLCRKIWFKYRQMLGIGNIARWICSEMKKLLLKAIFRTVILLTCQNDSARNQQDWKSMQKGWQLNQIGWNSNLKGSIAKQLGWNSRQIGWNLNLKGWFSSLKGSTIKQLGWDSKHKGLFSIYRLYWNLKTARMGAVFMIVGTSETLAPARDGSGFYVCGCSILIRIELNIKIL